MASTRLGRDLTVHHGDVEYERHKLVRRSWDGGHDDLELDELQHDRDFHSNRAHQHGLRHDSDAASVESFELYTPDEERIVVKKLDRNVTLFMSFLYLLAFLDRSSE